MAAALGMILGAGLGAAKQHLASERMHKDKIADMLMQGAANGQFDVSKSPEAMKIIEGSYGKDATGAATSIFSQMAAPMSGAPQIPGSGGGGGAPQAAGTPGGQQSQTGGAPASGGIHPGQIGDPNDPKTWQQYADSMQAFADQNPANARVQAFAKEHAALAMNRVKELQSQQNFEQTKGQQQQFHADTEADRELARQGQAQARAGQAETRAMMMGMKASQDQFERDYKTQQQSLEKERDQATKDSKVETLKRTVDTAADKITADFAAAAGKQNPDDIKSAFKARADSYNASAAQFYRKHADAGAPTLLKFNPGVPGKGLLRGAIPGLGTPGESPTLEAVPPRYGNYKGKSGWLDADGNFYPDAGTN